MSILLLLRREQQHKRVVIYDDAFNLVDNFDYQTEYRWIVAEDDIGNELDSIVLILDYHQFTGLTETLNPLANRTWAEATVAWQDANTWTWAVSQVDLVLGIQYTQSPTSDANSLTDAVAILYDIFLYNLNDDLNNYNDTVDIIYGIEVGITDDANNLVEQLPIDITFV